MKELALLLIKKKRNMYSREDLERFYFQYQTESLPKGQKDRYIAYLVDRVTDLNLDKHVMELVLEDFLKTQLELREEMAATYHSLISTVKLHGKSAWHNLGSFFTKIFNGCRDFLSLTPGNIEMAVSQ